MLFIHHHSASGLAQLALGPRLGCTGCPEAGWCHSCLPGEVSLARKLQETHAGVYQLPGCASVWPHGALCLIILLPGCWEGAVGAGHPSLSRRAAACLCTSDCVPLFIAAISEGGKNNGDLKGTEVCVGVCVRCHVDLRVNKHTCTNMRACLHTCAMGALGNQLL